MKTILIIDGAKNCAYDCYSADDELFELIFPAKGQDIEFIEDYSQRVGLKHRQKLWNDMWERPIPKKNIHGIDGTLFYELLEKRQFYPTKRDSDLDEHARGWKSDPDRKDGGYWSYSAES